jgi:ABC-type uncharacterized transport system substrate-binding protein
MIRREFITLIGGAAAAWPLAARAQQAERMRRIGVLVGDTQDNPETQARVAAFRDGLERLGWSEGRNVRIHYRFAAGNPDQFQPLAKELVGLQLDVLLAYATPAAVALQRESRTIPIVFVSVSDPVGSGLSRAWHARAAISPASCCTRRASLANGWPCFKRSRRDCRVRIAVNVAKLLELLKDRA